MAKQATGIDIGARTAIALRGRIKDSSFEVTGYGLSCYVASASEQSEVVEVGWAELALPFKLGEARVGVSGRDVNIRYMRVPRVPDWQLRKLMRFEVEEIGGQSGAEVASDFNVLPEMPEIEDEDVVLLGMTREELLESHNEGLERHGGKLEAYTPSSIGLYNAWLRYGVILDDTVLVANLGHDNTDVVLVRGTDLLFARNMSGGGGLFDAAIAERLGVSLAKSEQVKIDHVDLTPGARFEQPTAEKASRACMGPAGQLLSLLDSTVLFCKSQLKLQGLKIDRVMLCGGASALRGLDAYLANGMGVPVEEFDPFVVVDTSGLDPASADLLEEHKAESVVALGLATAGSDPDAYSIEILPADVRKKREFWGGTAFLVAAAILGVLFLALRAKQEIAAIDELEMSVGGLGRVVQQMESADRATEQLIVENQSISLLVDELYLLRGAGEQIARSVDALEASLPSDLWLSRLEARESNDEGLGMEQGQLLPVVKLEGRAREGTERVDEVLGEFYLDFTSELAVDSERESKHQLSLASSTFTVDLSMLGAPIESAVDDDVEDAQ